MCQQIINIFLASSLSLDEDRDKAEVSISALNDQINYANLSVKRSENLPKNIVINGTQNALINLVDDCQIFLCFVYDKIGTYTRIEFQAALQSLAQRGTPHIIVCLKNIPDNHATKMSFEDFLSREMFIEELHRIGYYWLPYEGKENLGKDLIVELNKIIRKDKIDKLFAKNPNPNVKNNNVVRVFLNESNYNRNINPFKDIKPFIIKTSIYLKNNPHNNFIQVLRHELLKDAYSLLSFTKKVHHAFHFLMCIRYDFIQNGLFDSKGNFSFNNWEMFNNLISIVVFNEDLADYYNNPSLSFSKEDFDLIVEKKYFSINGESGKIADLFKNLTRSYYNMFYYMTNFFQIRKEIQNLENNGNMKNINPELIISKGKMILKSLNETILTSDKSIKLLIEINQTILV